MCNKTQRYITPNKIFKNKKITQNPEYDIAIICFCPLPKLFENYKITNNNNNRLFLHLHNDHILFCEYNEIKFIVLSEVYGGPVCATIIEELHYYGITCIIGLGFVGSFTNNIGTNIKCTKSLAENGTTPHYSTDTLISTTNIISDLFDLPDEIVWTTNAIYQEYKSDVDFAKTYHCTCVNMDTSHFYAVCKMLSVPCLYLATVSDILQEQDTDWINELTECIDNNDNIVSVSQHALVKNIIDNIPVIKEKIELMFENYQNITTKSVKEILQENNMCKSHDINHILRVTNHTINALKYDKLQIREKYKVIFGAILHDIDDDKFFNTDNCDNARNILSKINLCFDDIEQIIRIIKYVSCSENHNNIPNEATNNEYLLYPRYADRLDTLGLNGVIRCYQYTKTKKGPLYVNTTMKPQTVDNIWEIATPERYENYKGNSASMIDHYYDKILQLGNFETENCYFKSKQSIKPFFDVIQKFIDGELTCDYMDSLVDQYDV